MNRRKFLLGAAAGAALLGTGYAARQSFSRASVTRTSWALGANVSLTVIGLRESAANRALDAAFAEIETVEQTMSLYRPASQLSQLNRDRVLQQPHPYLLTVLQSAALTSQQTEGAFDISVQPLWHLYSQAKRNGTSPTSADLAAVRQKINWRQVDFNPRLVRLHDPIEAITLNGLAQGFALDRALAALVAHGATSALIDTGEIGSLGVKAPGDAWTMGIQHPRERDAFVAVADLDGRALATSGDYETVFSADCAKNHIFNPRTAASPGELASASIVAPTGLQADALSTAAMVLGKEQTLALVAQLPHVDALLVDKRGNVVRTAGFPQANLS